MDSEYYERIIVNATFSTMPRIIPSNIHAKALLSSRLQLSPTVIVGLIYPTIIQCDFEFQRLKISPVGCFTATLLLDY